ncbi:MAG: endopeptidase La [Candidatus Dormibacteraeota bacterium]|nr:endopeptidase La [Candidatus Dormibacteraeota bacterium]MBO0760467.1 endopeptidase La [Candidatus Dormibacteraeota bacterium]
MADSITTSTLPTLPLKNTVVYPHLMVPLAVGRPRSLRLLEELPPEDRVLAVATQFDESTEEASWHEVNHVGTRVRIQQLLKLPDGTVQIAVQGLDRIRLTNAVAEQPYLVTEVEEYPEDKEELTELEGEALLRSAHTSFQQLVAIAPYLPAELVSAALAIEDRVHLAYFIAHHVRLSVQQRQEILELGSAREKLERLLGLMAHELEVLELGRQMQSRAEESIGKSQREYFLREQLKAIQRELGEMDQEAAEIAELRERIEAAEMPQEAMREAERELKRLERIPSASPESSVIRTYLELVVSLPWNRTTGGEIDVARSRRVLDEDHYDLEKVKQRIVEHLAVRRLKEERGTGDSHREPILCFVGPPGVGKTSLGQSIARAMGRTFARASLGGVHDEAEIRGHRRTYIGAMPGRIIQAVRRAESKDPVFILDEVDKVGADWRGDPSSALLEVLDPEQNKAFRDNYLDVPFDLSRVMFICTANTLDTVPPALRDRMEVLQLSGYTEEEKVQIARRFLMPKQLAANGLTRKEVRFGDRMIRLVIREYTREAGVRNLERELAGVLRRVAAQVAAGEASGQVRIDEGWVREALGKRRFFNDSAERGGPPGVATGLTWSPVGGEIIFVEARQMPGKGELQLTGQLGDVMKESASAALSYLKARASELGISREQFDSQDLHVHVPAGAVPKDGPSAGVTVLTAMASILSGQPVRGDLAMTGELTLRGRVLPVGGIKEKVLAAHRAGIRWVLVPSRNEADLDDIPADLREDLEITLVESIDQVLAMALPDLGGGAGAAGRGRGRRSARGRAAASA